MANNNVMKITTDDFLKAVEEVVNNRMKISNRESFIKDNHIMLPFKPKEPETAYLYEDGPDPVDGKLKAITSKQRREAFDKFVIDWRKQNSLEGTDVMPPTEVVPLWMRRAEGKNEDMTIAGQPEFNSFMDRFKKGSSNPKAPSLNHHSPEAQKLILSTGSRIRAM